MRSGVAGLRLAYFFNIKLSKILRGTDCIVCAMGKGARPEFLWNGARVVCIVDVRELVGEGELEFDNFGLAFLGGDEGMDCRVEQGGQGVGAVYGFGLVDFDDQLVCVDFRGFSGGDDYRPLEARREGVAAFVDLTEFDDGAGA